MYLCFHTPRLTAYPSQEGIRGGSLLNTTDSISIYSLRKEGRHGVCLPSLLVLREVSLDDYLAYDIPVVEGYADEVDSGICRAEV